MDKFQQALETLRRLSSKPEPKEMSLQELGQLAREKAAQTAPQDLQTQAEGRYRDGLDEDAMAQYDYAYDMAQEDPEGYVAEMEDAEYRHSPLPPPLPPKPEPESREWADVEDWELWGDLGQEPAPPTDHSLPPPKPPYPPRR